MSALAGARVVVSAGPTCEDIDPVRFIGNRSSGKMGFAMAAAAAARRAQVLLVAGPVHLPTPAGVARTDVRSAAQMRAAVLAALPADVYIGAAAVADYTPREPAPHKLKKSGRGETLVLELVRTRDILADVAASVPRPRLVVGFAAETRDLEPHARAKLDGKRLDLIVANEVGGSDAGFGSDYNAVTVFGPGGFARRFGRAPKEELAMALLDLIDERLAATP